MKTREQAAVERAEAGTKATHRPSLRRALEDVDACLRGYTLGGTVSARASEAATRAAGSTSAGPGVVGLASRTEVGYTMYDMFGEYTEVVSADAFDATLAASPLVEFTLNHNRGGGAPMAHTRNGTLVLAVSDDGLTYDASVDASRTDVADMLKALERGDLAESSFKFMIEAGQWSPDYTEFRILRADLDRGDVSSVNFGASPLTTSGIRAMAEEIAAAVVRRLPSEVVPDAAVRHRAEHRHIAGL